MRKKSSVLAFVFSMLSFAISAQVQTRIVEGQKTLYKIGDTLQISVFITTLPQTCLEGMDHVKFYKSGIEFIRQASWKELRKGLWQKNITLTIVENKKNKSILTIMRKTDKQSFMEQIGFEVER